MPSFANVTFLAPVQLPEAIFSLTIDRASFSDLDFESLRRDQEALQSRHVKGMEAPLRILKSMLDSIQY